MAIPIQNTNPRTDTWRGMIERIDQAFNVISNYAVTTSLTPTGGQTTGNAHVQGMFSSTTLVTPLIRGGTLTTPGPIEIGSNTTITGSLSVTANTTLTNVSATGNLNVIGHSLFSTAKFGGAVSMDVSLDVPAISANTADLKYIIGSGVNIQALATFSANTTHNGVSQFNGNINAAGLSAFKDLTSNTANINAASVGTLNATGRATVASANVVGSMRVGGDLSVEGNLIFSQTAYGDIIASGPGFALGNTSVRWAVYGTSADFTGPITLGNTLILNGNSTSAPAAGTGLRVRRPSANATLTWEEADNAWKAQGSNIVLANNAVYPIGITGNAGSATTATNAINLNNQTPAYYLNAANMTGTIPIARLSGTYNINITGAANTAANADNATYLDGQLASYYLAWNNLTGRPSTFAPSAHSHTIANITGLQGELDSKFNNSGGTVTGSVTVNTSTVNSGFMFAGGTAPNAGWVCNKTTSTISLLDSTNSIQPIIYNYSNGELALHGSSVKVNGQPILNAAEVQALDLNASRLTSGTVAAARLSGTYNITANNAINLNGQNSAYYLNAGNLTGTVASARLSGSYSISVDDSSKLQGQNGAYYLNAGNLTGTIASARLSGTYGINITGNAATATNATNATNASSAGNSNTVGGLAESAFMRRAVGSWANSSDGQDRFLFDNGGGTRVRGVGTVWLRVDNTDRLTASGSGVAVTGNLTATGGVTANQTSDSRLKKDKTKLTGALEKIEALTGYMWNWDESKQHVHGRSGSDMGILADDLEKIEPDFVGIDEFGYKYIRNGTEILIPIIIEAIKELRDELKSHS